MGSCTSTASRIWMGISGSSSTWSRARPRRAEGRPPGRAGPSGCRARDREVRGVAMTVVRWFLGLESAAFGAAALLHAGVLRHGYEHWKAATAESVIGFVLLAALVVSMVAPRSSRGVGLTALGFALAGTLVGVAMIAVGVGPQSSFDKALHVGFVLSLLAGLIFVARRSAAA